MSLGYKTAKRRFTIAAPQDMGILFVKSWLEFVIITN